MMRFRGGLRLLLLPQLAIAIALFAQGNATASRAGAYSTITPDDIGAHIAEIQGPRSGTGDGKLVVEIRGVDVYDPTTGQVRSSATDDIACWFIDTAYNGESFFVRHAYFTGAEEPYDKLKRALRAEIDESAWSALYQTRSYPLERPETGKIAVKVINHYGDEVLKVYEV